MMAFMILKTPGDGKVMVPIETFMGAVSNATRDDWTDIHTTAFPDGITVQTSFEGFVEAYTQALLAEPEEEE